MATKFYVNAMTSMILFAGVCAMSFANANPKCQGALGMQCGEVLQGQLAGCVPVLGSSTLVKCGINAGSWAHDVCCQANPNGRWCNGPATANAGACASSWNLAVSRVLSGHVWFRTINKNLEDNTPLSIDRGRFCASSGARIHVNDSATHCCSGRTREAKWSDFAPFNSKICR